MAPAELVASAVMSIFVAIVGGVVSCTITLKNDKAELPVVSLAVHVTLVSPNGNVEPETGVHVATPGGSTSSCVIGAMYVTTAPDEAVASIVMSTCGTIVGAVASCTITLND